MTGARRALGASCAFLLPALAACGAAGAGGARHVELERAATVDCLEQRRLPTERAGPGVVHVGRSPLSGRIVILRSDEAAQKRTLRGRAEGAEQIGSALVFVRNAPDSVLGPIETCLGEL